MNVLIGHDLELAVVRICAAEGTHPLSGSIPADFHRITDVLEAIESQVRLPLLTEAGGELGRLFEPLAHLVGNWEHRRGQAGRLDPGADSVAVARHGAVPTRPSQSARARSA